MNRTSEWLVWDEHAETIVSEFWEHETPEEIAGQVNDYLEQKSLKFGVNEPEGFLSTTAGGVVYCAERLGLIDEAERERLYKQEKAKRDAHKRRRNKERKEAERAEAERRGYPYRYLLTGEYRLHNDDRILPRHRSYEVTFQETRAEMPLRKRFVKNVRDEFGAEEVKYAHLNKHEELHQEEVVWLENGTGVPKPLFEALASIEDELFGDLTDEEYEALGEVDEADIYGEEA